MLSYKQANVPIALEAARAARRLAAKATPREQAHVAALDAWIAGDLDRALGVWEQILSEHPLDVLAFRLAHFNNFWLGRPGEMRASVERVKPKWAATCRATARSCPVIASRWRSAATTRPPRPRAAPRSRSIRANVGHACGRAHHGDAGTPRRRHRLARRAGAHWEGGKNLVHHLWWHRALFHLERREFDAVLDLYDGASAISQPAHAGAAGPLHRRAERRLDAVPARAARHRCRRPLERDRRQGRGAYRRLPLRLHVAALDDGARRDGARRCGAAHARRDARGRGTATERCADRPRRGAADLRSRAGAPERRLSPRPRL